MVGKMKALVNTACTRGKTKQQTKDGKVDDQESLPLSDCLSFSSVGKPWRGIITTLFRVCSHKIPLLVKIFQSVNKTDYRDWEGLPDHLIELIVEKLPFVDCLLFSGVCKEWKRITNIFLDGSSRGVPLLVKPFQSENITRTCLNVLDKNKNSSLNIPMQEYIGSYIWGSYRDWLFLMNPFEDHSEITLLNPFSREKVVLPKACGKCHKMAMSSVPSLTGCIYMLVHRNAEVSFWTLGARQWRRALYLHYNIRDALYHDGNFYLFISKDYKIVIIDEKSVVDMLNTGGADFNLWIRHTLELPGIIDMWQFDRINLVESCGDILLARRIFRDDGVPLCKTHGFETYRLDVSLLAWVKLESLGEDQVLFLGDSCSRSFHAKELGDALANKIYFSNSGYPYFIYEWDPAGKRLNNDYDTDDWGVISLQKKSIWYPTDHAYGQICTGIWVTAPIGWCLRQTQMHN